MQGLYEAALLSAGLLRPGLMPPGGPPGLQAALNAAGLQLPLPAAAAAALGIMQPLPLLGPITTLAASAAWAQLGGSGPSPLSLSLLAGLPQPPPQQQQQQQPPDLQQQPQQQQQQQQGGPLLSGFPFAGGLSLPLPPYPVLLQPGGPQPGPGQAPAPGQPPAQTLLAGSLLPNTVSGSLPLPPQHGQQPQLSCIKQELSISSAHAGAAGQADGNLASPGHNATVAPGQAAVQQQAHSHSTVHGHTLGRNAHLHHRLSSNGRNADMPPPSAGAVAAHPAVSAGNGVPAPSHGQSVSHGAGPHANPGSGHAPPASECGATSGSHGAAKPQNSSGKQTPQQPQQQIHMLHGGGGVGQMVWPLLTPQPATGMLPTPAQSLQQTQQLLLQQLIQQSQQQPQPQQNAAQALLGMLPLPSRSAVGGAPATTTPTTTATGSSGGGGGQAAASTAAGLFNMSFGGQQLDNSQQQQQLVQQLAQQLSQQSGQTGGLLGLGLQLQQQQQQQERKGAVPQQGHMQQAKTQASSQQDHGVQQQQQPQQLMGPGAMLQQGGGVGPLGPLGMPPDAVSSLLISPMVGASLQRTVLHCTY